MVISPFKGAFKLTSPRGNRMFGGKWEYHKGIDLVGIYDTDIYAVADGVVICLYEADGFGKYIRQKLPDGRRIYYGHLSEFYVKSGDTVRCGDVIGKMGATGKVTGAHLHLELRPAGTTSESLDICEFTRIPNKTGIYENDYTVEALYQLGIITQENIRNWELMLSGKAPLRKEYVRTIFDRCCQRIKEKT